MSTQGSPWLSRGLTDETSTTPESEGIFQVPASHSYTSPIFKGPGGGEEYHFLVLELGVQAEHPHRQLFPSRLANVLLRFCVGGWAFLPGEFKPDCQRIPAELEGRANGKFSQDEDQLGGVRWEEWGGGCVKWSLKSFHRSHMMKMARPLATQLDLLCVCFARTFQKHLSRHDRPRLYILIPVFD